MLVVMIRMMVLVMVVVVVVMMVMMVVEVAVIGAGPLKEEKIVKTEALKSYKPVF